MIIDTRDYNHEQALKPGSEQLGSNLSNPQLSNHQKISVIPFNKLADS